MCSEHEFIPTLSLSLSPSLHPSLPLSPALHPSLSLSPSLSPSLSLSLSFSSLTSGHVQPCMLSIFVTCLEQMVGPTGRSKVMSHPSLKTSSQKDTPTSKVSSTLINFWHKFLSLHLCTFFCIGGTASGFYTVEDDVSPFIVRLIRE